MDGWLATAHHDEMHRSGKFEQACLETRQRFTTLDEMDVVQDENQMLSALGKGLG
jgi:hypothetical protein